MDSVEEYVKSKGCAYISKSTVNNNIKLKIISTCGHPTDVFWKNFKYKGTGILCKTCVVQKIKADSRQQDQNVSALDVELRGIIMLRNLLSSQYEFETTREGCLADIIVKPKGQIENLWFGIQLKTTQTINDARQYSFSTPANKRVYSNCILILNELNEERIWCLPKDFKMPKSKINIGCTTKTKYAEYEVQKYSLVDKIKTEFQFYQSHTIEHWNTSTNKRCELEDFYASFRKTKLPFLTYIQPHRNGTCYDFTVNGMKVQEKSISLTSRTKDTMTFTLKKNDGSIRNPDNPTKKIRKYQAYAIGDNDFYWLWCKESSLFYIIPERILVDNNIIGPTGKGNLIIPKKGTLPWIHPYTFDINNIDETKIKSFFTST